MTIASPSTRSWVVESRIVASGEDTATERALRGVVIGRKNHYGSRSERGTEVAALFYSLIESAKLAGVEPDAFLRTAARLSIRNERTPLPRELTTA